MLNSILLQSGSQSLSLSFAGVLACSISSLVLGIIIAFCYMLCSEKYNDNFVVTIVILPVLVQAVVMMVNGNLGTGIAIAGAFSLVRFRSVPGTAREICMVFFAMAVGLATGTGYIGYGAIITLFAGASFVALTKLRFGKKEDGERTIKITLPENLNYSGLFDDIFEKYLYSYKLDRVKTTNLGSMFELTYMVKMKKTEPEKDMIDAIRVRNGNLPVVVGQVSSPVQEL